MKNVFDFITTEESSYQTQPVTIMDNWDYSMFKHVLTTVLYKNSTYLTGKDDNKPFKNITRPILNLQYRAEGFDVDDIELFVDSEKDYYKSFIVKKFHNRWARENDIDTFIDQLVESYVDFGGVLVKNVNEKRPEVVPMQRLAFVDQTDILGGAICEKHYLTPQKLKEMKKQGWENTDELAMFFEQKKTVGAQQEQENTAGRYIEVYELHGQFPKNWLKEDGEHTEEDEYEYEPQIHIVSFYKDEQNKKKGITLFKGIEKKEIYKFLARDEIYGRALGLGGAEELFEAQVWTNYDILRIKGMLDLASKVIYQTADKKFANRNKTYDLDNGEILVHQDGKPVSQIDTTPRNITLFENSIAEWEAHAQQMGAAHETIMGESPKSGTPFKLQELVTAEAHSLHIYRRGKIAVFIDDIYRDWVIPYIVKEIRSGDEWIEELTLDELQEISDDIVENAVNNRMKELTLQGEVMTREEMEQFKQQTKDVFMKSNKKLIRIVEDELKDAPLNIRINVVGKQKDLAGLTDKLVNVFRTVVANPAILQDPTLSKIFNRILQYSGLDPIDFVSLKPSPQLQQGQQIPNIELNKEKQPANV